MVIRHVPSDRPPTSPSHPAGRTITDTNPNEPQPRTRPAPVDFLILGAGWTSTFLIPLLDQRRITLAATTTTGRDGTIPFKFDAETSDRAEYQRLPYARTVLITFPLRGKGQSGKLTAGYLESHPRRSNRATPATEEEGDGHEPAVEDDAERTDIHFILLGSTGIFNQTPHWTDRRSPYDVNSPRAIAEDELLRLHPRAATVLSLAGLYGGQRNPRDWVGRVVGSKEDVRKKRGVHLVHGRDVARGIVGVAQRRTEDQHGEGGLKSRGQRWIVNDLRVYDWWDLFLSWGGGDREEEEEEHEEQEDHPERERTNSPPAPGENLEERTPRLHASPGESAAAAPTASSRERTEKMPLSEWVRDLMLEEGVRALPRGPETLGRVVDGREFWQMLGMAPAHGRVGS